MAKLHIVGGSRLVGTAMVSLVRMPLPRVLMVTLLLVLLMLLVLLVLLVVVLLLLLR